MGQGIDLLGALTRVVPERRAPRLDLSGAQSLLIVKLSSIGDVVHALPVASALKQTYPGLRITWAVEEWTAPLVQAHPCVDRVIVFPTLVRWPANPRLWARQLRAALGALRSERYDVAVDLQGLARSAIISALSRSARRIARAGQREGAHLVSRAVALPDARLHAVDEYLHVASNLGARVDRVLFLLQAPEDARRAVDRLLSLHRVGDAGALIVINPSAAQPRKQWPAERWPQVVDRLMDVAAVVLVGADADARGHADIADRAARRPIDLTGKTTLAQLIALLERASLHVAPDTGTVHIAVALGTPVVALHGPSRPWRVGPYRQMESAIHHGDRCGAMCPAYCLRRRRCLRAITVDEVVAKAREVLARSAMAVQRGV